LRISGPAADIDLEKVTQILQSHALGVTLKRLDEADENIEVLYSVVFESFEDLVQTRKEVSALSSAIATSYFDNIGNI
jgi:hypothetical protein